MTVLIFATLEIPIFLKLVMPLFLTPQGIIASYLDKSVEIFIEHP